MRNEDRLPANVPDAALEKARQVWFENYGSSVVEKRRYFFATIALALVSIALSVALMLLAPLKSAVPYVITVDRASGVPSATDMQAVRYQPGERELRYFLGRWVTKLYTIDRYTMTKDLNEAFYQTRSKASEQFSEFMAADNPIAAVKAEMSLTRVVTVRSVNFIQDGAAVVRISTTERSAATTTKQVVTNLALTIHYISVPPATEKEVFENPLGLYVTHFAVTKEL